MLHFGEWNRDCRECEGNKWEHQARLREEGESPAEDRSKEAAIDIAEGVADGYRGQEDRDPDGFQVRRCVFVCKNRENCIFRSLIHGKALVAQSLGISELLSSKTLPKEITHAWGQCSRLSISRMSQFEA